MTVIKKYNSGTSTWETIVVGAQGTIGAQGAQGVQGPQGVARLTASDTTPASPTTGDMWYQSTTGITYTYYDSFWVEIGSGAQGPQGVSGARNLSVTTITSSATPAINTNVCEVVTITSLATAITSMTTSLTGTPANFDRLVIRIKDNGTARAIAWGASFVQGGVALPTTTVASKVLTVGFIYDSVKTAWSCVAVAQEA